MMDGKTLVLLQALREAAINQVAALEDCLGTEYDKSALAKRRAKAREYGKGQGWEDARQEG